MEARNEIRGYNADNNRGLQGGYGGAPSSNPTQGHSETSTVPATTLPGDFPNGGANTETKEEYSVNSVNRLLMEFLMYLGKSFLFLYPVYLTGSLGLSISWILLFLMMWTWWRRNRKHKDVRLDTAIDFLENERTMISKELKALNMPAWVQFPDVEKADWLNKILQQAWPFFGMYMEKLLKENIQSSIRTSSPHLKTFTFTKVHFGQKPLQITGVKVYTEEVEQREVILDLNLRYAGDVDIDAEVKKPITAGVKGLLLEGMLRVILEPLVGQSPLVGGITMFFIRRPKLDINWTGVTNLLDSPALSQLSETTIVDIISSIMVLPNRMCIPLIDQVKVDQMRFPLPRGVVRVNLLEAQDLIAKDSFMLGMVKGKSDPYAILRVGTSHFRSKTVKENLDPRWNEVYEFVVHEAPGQELEVELFDEDTDKDDFLGRFNLDLGDVMKERIVDKWYTLDDVESGKVHLNMQWLSLLVDPAKLVETQNGCACAMLAVYLDNATNLPKDQSEFTHKDRTGKPPKEARLTRRNTHPNSFVEFSIDKQTQKSKVAYAKDPVWEECFTFFVHSVNNQQLKVQVKEPEKKTPLGTLSLPLTRLLNASDLTLDQRFLLERSGANSQIKMKATLRILQLEKPKPKPVKKSPPAEARPQAPPQHNAISSSSSAPSHAALAPPGGLQPATARPGPINGLHPEYYSPRFQPAGTPESRTPAPGTPILREGSVLRRYDSHSLLSENSLASSRFDLSEGAPFPESILNHQGSFGEIRMTVRYATLKNRLIVVVDSCRGLFPCSENGSDVYVRLYLLPDQSWRHRMRTHVKKKTVDPIFNEKFEFDVPLEEAKNRKLDVAVKNNRMFHSRERKDIGMVLVDLAQVDLAKGSTEWYELSIPGLKKVN
ncbi:extended synaptotagmin-3 [Anguilla rostrata]|uniref:extended synaptotagmin-3 n=1 Tax=Anguilla rostrata TaxID=7938 RepID=UPI0030CF4435